MWRLLLGTMGVKSLVQGLNAAATAGFEPRTVWSEVRRRNRLATAPCTCIYSSLLFIVYYFLLLQFSWQEGPENVWDDHELLMSEISVVVVCCTTSVCFTYVVCQLNDLVWGSALCFRKTTPPLSLSLNRCQRLERKLPVETLSKRRLKMADATDCKNLHVTLESRQVTW